MAAVHGYSVAFTVSAALFGLGALVAVLLLPSRRRLEDLRNAALADGVAPADRPTLADATNILAVGADVKALADPP